MKSLVGIAMILVVSHETEASVYEKPTDWIEIQQYDLYSMHNPYKIDYTDFDEGSATEHELQEEDVQALISNQEIVMVIDGDDCSQTGYLVPEGMTLEVASERICEFNNKIASSWWMKFGDSGESHDPTESDTAITHALNEGFAGIFSS